MVSKEARPNGSPHAVFAVTPAGIISTDPINAEAAQWLKAEFLGRFNRPVKYLIYSHDHADHTSGGEVFADTAVVVAQENAERLFARPQEYSRGFYTGRTSGIFPLSNK
jgi:glyoxylase-like metal-dependent hydrolase (beta-lactamase superfamily II)